MTRCLLLAALGVAALLVGCTAPAGRTTSVRPTERTIDDADPDEVLTEAAGILQREFGRLRIDRSARRIETTPVEYTTSRDSGSARDLVGGRSTMRRRAWFESGQRGGMTFARLRVDVEREDTQRRAVMTPQYHRVYGDNPGFETPIERDAATTEQQNTIWTRLRADTALERSLLDELRERFARRSAEPEAPPPAPTPPVPTQPARE